MHTPSLKQLTKQSQSLKQMQHLLMSQEMQQALSFLELPIMELQPLIDQELENNPLLEAEIEEEEIEEQEKEEEEVPFEELKFEERDLKIIEQIDEELSLHVKESSKDPQTIEDEKLKNYLDSLICEKDSLFSHLMKEVSQLFLTKEEQKLAEEIVGNLDERGFLKVSLEEISLLSGFSIDPLKSILEKIQTLEPKGIGASNLQESLLLQLKLKGQKEAFSYQIIEHHYQDLLNNRIPLIKKALKMTPNEMESALNEIKKLDLNPAASFEYTPLTYIIPDVSIKEEDGTLQVFVNEDPLPPLRLNRRYLELLEDKSLLPETKEFIEKKIASAKWMLKNLSERNETLARISHLLVKKQKVFLETPEGKLLPLTMLEIAAELNLHESTVTRAVSNKYVNTPRGLLSLRSFFTHGLSSELSSASVKQEVSEIIKNENKKKPLSDESILKLLQEKGMSCARRTIAKYRKQLNIASAHQRKTF
ncbi:MAG TPA: RNA polymerase factor sigma-54 [Parachlamydiaceae bacterium]|nr:RNA polymerase factor sigma-54 [Parachlamydiaceae bacterium]